MLAKNLNWLYRTTGKNVNTLYFWFLIKFATSIFGSTFPSNEISLPKCSFFPNNLLKQPFFWGLVFFFLYINLFNKSYSLLSNLNLFGVFEFHISRFRCAIWSAFHKFMHPKFYQTYSTSCLFVVIPSLIFFILWF